MVCSIASFDLYCAIVGGLIVPLEVYCASVSQYYLSFKLSGKVVFYHLFCHLSFFSSLLLHSFSNYIIALRDER